MKKVNPYLLGICIAYVILGINQILSSEIISYKIYFVVSLVSLCVSVTELVKITQRYLKQHQLATEELIHMCEEYYKMLDADDINNIVEQNDVFLKLENQKKLFNSNEKKSRLIYKISEVLMVLSYANSVCFMILVPWMNISNELLTNKISGVATLFCFALMFFTNLLNEFFDKTSANLEIEKKELINNLNDALTDKQEIKIKR